MTSLIQGLGCGLIIYLLKSEGFYVYFLLLSRPRDSLRLICGTSILNEKMYHGNYLGHYPRPLEKMFSVTPWDLVFWYCQLDQTG